MGFYWSLTHATRSYALLKLPMQYASHVLRLDGQILITGLSPENSSGPGSITF